MSRARRTAALALAGFVGAGLWGAALAGGPKVYDTPLKVCADPNNMPFSNKAGEGFENRLAEMIAADWGTRVEYTWYPQRRGFLRHTLNALECDVVMGVPQIDGIETTRSYYRSTYVFVTRPGPLSGLSSIRAPELAGLRVAIHLVGEDGANTPPGAVLAQRGIVDNVVGFSIYGDYREPDPTAAPVKAVADGEVDVAALWGPIGAWFAKVSDVPLEARPITDTAGFPPQVFSFAIAMGVRRGDIALKAKLDDFIRGHDAQIRELLKQYGVPLV